jgi:TetR/AcrR family transcriptional regulator
VPAVEISLVFQEAGISSRIHIVKKSEGGPSSALDKLDMYYTDRYSTLMEEVGGNKSNILATALRLFSDRGYEAVGIAELCDSSKVTKPTLYHYFGSKRGLLDAIVEERGGPLLARVDEASVYAHDVPRGLESIAFAFARSAKEDGAFARLRLSLSFAPPASEAWLAASALNDAIFSKVEAFFLAASGDHGNMKGRSRPYAAAFIGTVDTYVGLYLSDRSPLTDDIVRGAVRQFMYGIFS